VRAQSHGNKQVARTTGVVVRVFSLTTMLAVSYSSAVSKLRRPFFSNRYFFITVRLLKRRAKLTETDLTLLARVATTLLFYVVATRGACILCLHRLQ
jgi:hypothetical protein